MVRAHTKKGGHCLPISSLAFRSFQSCISNIFFFSFSFVLPLGIYICLQQWESECEQCCITTILKEASDCLLFDLTEKPISLIG